MVNRGLGTESYYLLFWPSLAVFINVAKLCVIIIDLYVKGKTPGSFVKFICSKLLLIIP